MKKIKEIMDGESISAERIGNRIRDKFKKLDIHLDKRTDRIPTDFNDIYWIFKAYIKLIDLLISKNVKSRKEVLKIMNIFWFDLFYIHLDYHYKGAKKPLLELIEQMETGNVKAKRRGKKNTK